MYRKIIDVSTYNKKIDWKKAVSNGVEGAIIKIVNKQLERDGQFNNNYVGCHNQKIDWGVYNYSYATTPEKAKSDMKVVCNILDKLNKKYFTLGVWFDIEDSCQAELSKSKIAEIINAAQEVVEERGYNFGVYTGMAYYKAHIDPAKVKCKNWWIARYYKGYETMKIGINPNKDYIPTVVKNLFAWQYTSSGTIASGVSTGNGGKFDLNIQYRDFPAKEDTKKKVYGRVATKSDPLRMRTKATIFAKVVRKIARGAKVEIVQKGKSWHKVKYAGSTGYCSAKYIKLL